MNCREFEAVAAELARGPAALVDDAASALAHVAACASCARRLQEQEALTGALRALAASLEAAQAPPHLEAELLAAYRNRPAGATARPWRPWAAAALAAGILLAAVVARREPGPKPAAPEPAQLMPDPRKEASAEPAPANARPAAPRPRLRRAVPKPPAPPEAGAATEFLPLPFSQSLTPPDSVQIIRVRLPRSALASFGFPVDLERGGERIQADVLLGEDGLARAVRFVR